jgi:isopenicillin-N epimerase
MAVHWRLDPSVVFLNHGSFGACPTVVLEKQRDLRDLLEREPIRFFVERAEGLIDEARRCVATLVNADAPGIVFVPNATAGVNAVVRSLRFSPGDELLTNSHEYNACNNVLRWAAEQWGARVVSVPVPFPVRSAREVVDAVLAGVTSRTKLVMLSHVTSPTGLVLPVGPLVEELTRCGIDTLIDGAHAPGMIPLDLAALGATYYTGNFHKWLCTPKGSGFLHVREDKRGVVRPNIISHGANSPRTDKSRYLLEFDYVGTFEVTPWLCVPEAVRFLSSLVPGGLNGLMEHNRRNAVEARKILCRALGAEPAAPEGMLGALASVHLPDPPGGAIRPSQKGYHDRLNDELLDRHGVQIPIMPFPPPAPGQPAGGRLIRVAMQAYNSLEQVEYAAECVREELARERAGG